MSEEAVAIVDFGSQYSQLIARRVRENHVFSVLVGPDVRPEQLAKLNLAGIILSGGPASVYEPDAPGCDKGLLELGVPVLGICYGMQIGCQMLGAQIKPAKAREYGRTELRIIDPDRLFVHVPQETTAWMSHGDIVVDLPEEFLAIARTGNCPMAAVQHRSKPFYGVQFHPEVSHTPSGGQILRNFIYDICRCKGTWQMGSFADQAIQQIRTQVGSKRVICALSGGVDSSVVAVLLHKAIGDKLTCIFVDNGLLRKNEAELVESTFHDHFNIDGNLLWPFAWVAPRNRPRWIFRHQRSDLTSLLALVVNPAISF